MGNSSISTKNNNSFGIEISEVERSERTRRRILYRVPPQLRENKIHIFDPVVLSLGPYHHNRSPNSKFLPVEEFKNEVLSILLDPAAAREFFYSKILERVDEIRIFYGGVSIDEYKDEELAEMMLRDTCFVLYYMEIMTGNMEKGKRLLRRLGLSVAIFLFRDMFMLENQIPLWIVNLLISLKFHDDKDKGEALLCKFLSMMGFMDYITRVPWEDKDQEPLHLLEAIARTVIKGEISSTIEVHHQRTFGFGSNWGKGSQIKIFEMLNSPFRSVTNLKMKGIHFGPSSTCLTDVRFNSYWFYGKLQLPIWYITNNSPVFLSNVIALEMSPENDKDFAMISYVNFVKSLIESPKDVKELREKGILFSVLRNDEEVVKMLKEIDTYGMNDINIFQDVKMRIHKHCKSKAKTWMAELLYTKFRTPWTVIALLATMLFMCLTFLQTYYTINPQNSN